MADVKKSTEEVHLFYGSKSPFSNFHPCVFKLGHGGKTYTYNTSEQRFMHRKALFFNDAATAQKIMAEKSPTKQKRLGRQVKNFDETKWDAESDAAMEEAV